MIFKRAVAVGFAAMTTFWFSSATAAELVMFEERGCPWCVRWHAEVGVGYPKSSEGQRAPLRVVDIHAARPSDIAFIKGIRASPTFVLIDRGREIGRIVGYPGSDFFWGLFGQMFERISAGAATESATRCPAGGRDVLAGSNSC